jgi:hypothetical protein
MRAGSALFSCAAVLALAACSGETTAPGVQETEVPDDLASYTPPPRVSGQNIGTPLADRVATLGILNKRNNLTQDVKLKPGEAKRWGDVIVRLEACERTPPWETPPQTGAFVRVLIAQRANPSADPDWVRAFSGWLFKESPSLNVVEHPIYDVWVKDCAMSFPGDEAAAEASDSSEENPAGTASPTPTPSPTPAPAPAAATT